MLPKPSPGFDGSAETGGAGAGADSDSTVFGLSADMVLALSNVCWNSVEISAVLKRAANFSSLPSLSEKSMAAQIQELLADFISASFMSAVM